MTGQSEKGLLNQVPRLFRLGSQSESEPVQPLVVGVEQVGQPLRSHATFLGFEPYGRNGK
jgi:hypothetical protein